VFDYSCACHAGFERLEGKTFREGFEEVVLPDGTFWSNCDIERDLCSNPNPCQNNATCSYGGGRYNCACRPGFEGENCEVDIDLCKDVQFAVGLLQINASQACKYNCAEYLDDAYVCTCGSNQTLGFEFDGGHFAEAFNTNATLNAELVGQLAQELGVDPSAIEAVELFDDGE
jgi:hypothetical protein